MDSTTDKASVIIVLGMHRSGTSALTQLISTLGYNAGNNLMPANFDNPKGYWEDLDIYQLNNDILSFLFLTWDQTEEFNYRKINILNKIIGEKFHKRGCSIISKKLKYSSKIVIKDPRFCILLPFWNSILRELKCETHYILSVRNPIDVAISIKKRNNLSMEESLKLWYYYYGCCLIDIPEGCLVINFEELVKKPNVLIDNLINYINLKEKGNIFDKTGKVIDRSLINNQTDSNELEKFAISFPEAFHLYNRLNTSNIINKGEIEDFIEINNNYLKKKSPTTLTSSLFYNFDKNSADPPMLVQQIHQEGLVKLSFALSSYKDNDQFNLFFCDKPCLVRIFNFYFVTDEEEIGINTFEGNYIFNESNLYLFNSNTPEIKFYVKNQKAVRQIIIEAEFITAPLILASIIIPIFQNNIDRLRKRLYQLETDNLNDKDQLFLLEDSYKLMTSEMTSEIDLLYQFKKELNLAHEKNRLLADKNILLSKENEELIFQNKQLNDNLDKTIIELQDLGRIILYREQELDRKKIQNDNLERVNQVLDQEKERYRIESSRYRNQLKEEQNKSEYLFKLKLDHEREIDQLKNNIIQLNSDIYAFKHSLSWKITWPFRMIYSLLIYPFSFLKPITEDFHFGIELYRREGFKRFFIRLWWYLRGKRLDEDIYLYKNNIKITPLKSDHNFSPLLFPATSDPRVSIIIPVYNQWEYTYGCIKSIHENTKDIPFEIIVADDCSTDQTINISDIIKGIEVIHNQENLKFILNNNNAAKRARGEYILFLNNDTRVHPNWLRSLVDVLDNDEKAGIVGSKLLFPNGRLQEAGGIIWNDASGWNYGKFDDPQKPEYNYLRETDYVSGASLMIRKSLWEKLGGFDELFVPAYYEDTDIAFRAREAGYKVIYQPLSVVTHFEGLSNGKELSKGLKQYQVTNALKFKNRWQQTLTENHFVNSENVFLAKDRSRDKKHLLVIDHYVPQFDKDAGSRSTFSYLCLLSKMGFNIKFIGDNFFQHEPYTTLLQQKGIEVLYGNYYARNIHLWLKENGKYFSYVILHRMHIAPKYLDSVKKYTSARLFYVGHDLHYISSLRKYDLTKDPTHLTDSQKFKEIESIIFNTVDVILPFSTYEAPFIQEIVPNKTVQQIPVYFYEKIPEECNGFNSRKDLLFVGGFGHPPNIDALKWFVKEVFPLIQSKIDGVKIYVVGSNPTREVIELANDQIIITGYVSDEKLKSYYENCRIAILPLRFGAGVKGKLLEACYYQIPTVITSVAAEGIPSIEDYTLIADSKEEFAEKAVELYNNASLWQHQSLQSKKLIEDNFMEDSAKRILTKYFN
jgi:GT2 family glycosyltransferase